MIESAKITYSRIGVHPCTGENSVLWIPRIALRIQGRKSAKIGYLSGKDRIDRFGKKDYQGLCILPDFIVVVTRNEYIIVDEDAKERISLDPVEVGRIVGVQTEGFLSVKENHLMLRDITGQVIGERELTAEEIAELNK